MAVSYEPNTVAPAIGQSWGENATSETVNKTVHCFDPLLDSRWESFVANHPRASVFHCSAWLEALHRTYGYKPIAFTSCLPNERLENAIVFSRVESWLTGRRLVSLPFSDHCEPLVESEQTPGMIAAILNLEMARANWSYLELRPLETIPVNTSYHHTGISYAFHQLDLRPDLDSLFSNFHKSSIQRKIRRAEREGLIYREGFSDELFQAFYRLLELTRKRHRIPPQPREWFINLMKCFGPALKIRVVSTADRAVAAMITLCHKETMVYKYGCSDALLNNLGGMHLLFWQAIQEAKAASLTCFDFGRTDADQRGLITFKNRWGAAQAVLSYSRFGASESATHILDLSTATWKTKAAKGLLSTLPSGIVSRIGEVLYEHVG